MFDIKKAVTRFLMLALAVLILSASVASSAVALDAPQEEAQEVVENLYQLLLEEFNSDEYSAWEAEERASLMYEACYKNPAGSSLVHPQKQMYCLIPLSFRLCLTPKLLILKARKGVRSEEGPVLFQECEKEKNLDFASRIPNFNEAFNSVFFVDDPSKIVVGENFDFAGLPQLSDRSFARVLAESGSQLVRDKEASLCRNVIGEDNPACGR